MSDHSVEEKEPPVSAGARDTIWAGLSHHKEDYAVFKKEHFSSYMRIIILYAYISYTIQGREKHGLLRFTQG